VLEGFDQAAEGKKKKLGVGKWQNVLDFLDEMAL
jgi:hypothetical protein